MLEAILLGLGAHWTLKNFGNGPETPRFTGHLGDDPHKPLANASTQRYRGKIIYRLYIVAGGRWALVMQAWEYPAILAAFQDWERFVDDGGTVDTWHAQNYLRHKEAAYLEKSL